MPSHEEERIPPSGNLLIPRKRPTDSYISLSPWLTRPSEGASGHPVRMPFAGATAESRTPCVLRITCPSIWQQTWTTGYARRQHWCQGRRNNLEWRQAIEKRQLASEKQLRALLQETEKLREENAVLRIQASTSGPPRRQRSRGQVANSRPEPESIYPGSTGVVPGACNAGPHEPRTPMPRAPRPQEPGRSRPPVATTRAPRPDPMIAPMVQNVPPHRDPMVTPAMRNVHSHLVERPAGRNLPNKPPIGSISKRLDDMLSTPFCSRITHYEPPRGFLVPKFSTYDGNNDPFDHIMHYRQLMTLDIGNDALLCKVFPASLQGQALSWFHHLPLNSVDNFRDLSEAFVGQYLCSARHKQNISTLHNIKMKDNESLREFVKRFGQAVLQIEACSMDAVLQIFKRSICPGTPFFESLAKKPPTTMDDLFRRANKYSMLEDDVRAATQQVLVAGRASRNDADRHAKPPDRSKPVDRRQDGPSRPDRPPITPLSVSYEKLLPMIQDLSDFSTSAQILEEGTYLNIITLGPEGPVAPKAVINYINGGPSDEEYDSRRKRQKLLRAASIRERINSIRPGLTGEGPRPIDGTIIFPPVDPTRTLQPHRDALILSLEIGDFDVRRILVDPGSSADLVQALVIGHMGHSLAGLENPGRILSGFNGSSTTSLGDIILPIQAGQSLSTCNSQWYKSYHPSMSSWDAHGFTT
ncbi:hypothetical protein CK203_002115 [Vitis vinifera]|uniref:Retrotransposon gag domain-containing protein n=1 Tax=Vitis vinifera TaxID=29760 RepID=A0A438KJU9_VITVI|nr:hypothetical protein CK203_002115 [Vitis vinifera]